MPSGLREKVQPLACHTTAFDTCRTRLAHFSDDEFCTSFIRAAESFGW